MQAKVWELQAQIICVSNFTEEKQKTLPFQYTSSIGLPDLANKKIWISNKQIFNIIMSQVYKEYVSIPMHTYTKKVLVAYIIY